MSSPHKWLNGAINKSSELINLRVFPAPRSTDAPEHVPQRVADLFKQAADTKNAKNFDTAALAYRKMLEVALKSFVSDLEIWALGARIEKLAITGKITPSMQDWANAIRILGNDAAHSEVEVTETDVEEIHSFSEMLLVCLYTLPERIKRWQKERIQKKGGSTDPERTSA